jgi:hypothetical protein
VKNRTVTSPPAASDPRGFPAWLRAYWSRVVAGLAFAVVAGVTGYISYTHIEALTLALHQPPTVARLMPFGVDGLIVVGSVALLQATDDHPYLGWVCVAPGAVASLFANVESGLRYGILSAAWAGLASAGFFLATFTLERWLKSQAGRGGQPGRTDEDPAGLDFGERDADLCAHFAASTAEEAAVQAFLHARDCLSEPLSQRQLSDQFGISRPKVAELVKPHVGPVRYAAFSGSGADA